MKRLLVKVLAYLALLAIGQACVAALWPCPGLEEHRALARRFLTPPPNVVLVTDSSGWSPPHAKEPDRRTTGGMLDALLNGTTVAHMLYPGHGMSDFVAHFRFMTAEMEPLPRIVLIAVNVTAFGKPWHSDPHQIVIDQRIALSYPSWFSRLCYRPFTTFRIFNLMPQTTEEFERNELCSPEGRTSTAGQVREMLLDAPNWVERGKLLYNWTDWRIDRRDRLVRDMLRCGHLLREAGIYPIFYVTPLDVDFVNSQTPPSTALAVEEAIVFLVETLQEEGYETLDLSRDLGSEHFVPDPLPVIHLTASGRQYVAERLAEEIRSHQGRTDEGARN